MVHINPDESVIIYRLMDIAKQLKNNKNDYDKDYFNCLMQERYQIVSKFTTHIDVPKWKLWWEGVRHQLPSQSVSEQWLYAYHSNTPYTPDDKIHGGKWLIFLPMKYVDKVWVYIKEATKKGLLGASAKCSTMQKTKYSIWKDKVICVYTDTTNDIDIFTLRYQLLKLGFHKLLSFKTNQSTKDGKYWVNGDREISLYRI